MPAARARRTCPKGRAGSAAARGAAQGEARAAYKTRDKYNGDYSRITDLARMTLKCATLADALATLRALAALGSSGWDVLLLKDRPHARV